MLGDCTGGALRLADGRRFVRTRRWHRYNGALVEHSVEKFKGERLTVVLYSRPTPGDSCKEVRNLMGVSPALRLCLLVPTMVGEQLRLRRIRGGVM